MTEKSLAKAYLKFKEVDLKKEKSITNIKFSIIHIDPTKKKSKTYEKSVIIDIRLYNIKAQEKYVINDTSGLNFYQGDIYNIILSDDGSTCVNLNGDHYIAGTEDVLLIKKV